MSECLHLYTAISTPGYTRVAAVGILTDDINIMNFTILNNIMQDQSMLSKRWFKSSQWEARIYWGYLTYGEMTSRKPLAVNG